MDQLSQLNDLMTLALHTTCQLVATPGLSHTRAELCTVDCLAAQDGACLIVKKLAMCVDLEACDTIVYCCLYHPAAQQSVVQRCKLSLYFS